MKIIRVILTVYFGWLLIKGISLFFRTGSMDRLLFESAGLGWLFWIFLCCIVSTAVITLVYIQRPSVTGYHIANAGVVLDLILTIIGTAIGIVRPEVMKQAFIASRQERGLPIREEMLTLMTSPGTQLFSALVGVTLAGVCLYLLSRIHQEATPKPRRTTASGRWPQR